MKRFTTVPITLYRFQNGVMPILREKSQQFSKFKTSFDFTLGQNKLYNPVRGEKYLGPNGLSLRPMGQNLAQFFQSFHGNYIIQISKGVKIPNQLILVHERSDHYSLQTKQSVDPKLFCERAKQFFQKQKKMSKQQVTQKIKQYFS